MVKPGGQDDGVGGERPGAIGRVQGQQKTSAGAPHGRHGGQQANLDIGGLPQGGQLVGQQAAAAELAFAVDGFAADGAPVAAQHRATLDQGHTDAALG
jgi:hypothetical protein